MKKYIALFLLLLNTTVQAQQPENFTGKWTTDENTMVEIYTLNHSYYAKIIGNEKNKKEAVVLIQMQQKSATQLYGGTYYDTDLKTEYEAKLKLLNPTTIRLKILSGIFHKTIYWHRVYLSDEKTSIVTITTK